ncbi:hypothetical protein Prudu_778S000100 [Prunus dulcis]|uniref:Transposable element protein n=1 Tax=Prunus dulcis TaxID=3755 RepID=A0A5H2XQA3_PRUDU|nr:hypothetical protein Prudu_778S000100 [Prunus dulcis]
MIGSSDALIQEVYKFLIPAQAYLTFTRPVIAFAVNSVCQYMTAPTDSHFFQVKRILRYLQGTLQYGINFSLGPMQLSAFSDADWAGDASTCRTTTGFVVFLGNNPISWQSKKQGSVSCSSTEADYQALANTAADIVWIRQVLAYMHEFLPEPPLLHCDNLSALTLSSNPVFYLQIKHLDIDFHFIRERVQHKDFHVQQFTKGLHGPIFSKHCINLRLGHPAEIEGGCLAKDTCD